MKLNDEKGLRFNVQFDESPNQNIPFQVVVFDRDKKTIYQSQVNEKSFSLPFSADELKDKRVFLAPYTETRKTQVSIETLEKGNGFEVNLPSKINPDEPVLINTIPQEIWRWWFFCFCH